MKENDIDNLFRETFQNAEESPKRDIWQNIEKELDASSEPIKFSKKKVIWFPFAAAAVLLLTLGVVLKLMQQSNYKDELPKKDIIVNRPTSVAQEREIKSDIITGNKNKILTEQENKSFLSIKKNITIKKNISAHDRIQERRKIANIEYQLEEEKLDLAHLSHIEDQEFKIRQVTEIEDIKPLIEPEEEMESMLAATNTNPDDKNVVTSILNKITDKIIINEKNTINFSTDEEGSFKINIINSIAKNRNKKRR